MDEIIKRKRGRPLKIKPVVETKSETKTTSIPFSGYHGLRAFPKSDQLRSHKE